MDNDVLVFMHTISVGSCLRRSARHRRGLAACPVILMFSRLQAGLRRRRASELLCGTWSMTLSPSITINRAFHEFLGTLLKISRMPGINLRRLS
jgi:hypothetical protein